MINIYIFHIYLPCTIVHSTENQKNCWKPLFIPIKIILWQKSIFLIYKKNQYVQNGAKCRMIDRIFGCFVPFWNHYFIWWWLVICDKYGKAFRNICLLIGYDLNDLDASWGHHDAKCFNLQPEEINILNFILHEPLLKEALKKMSLLCLYHSSWPRCLLRRGFGPCT